MYRLISINDKGLILKTQDIRGITDILKWMFKILLRHSSQFKLYFNRRSEMRKKLQKETARCKIAFFVIQVELLNAKKDFFHPPVLKVGQEIFIHLKSKFDN